MGDTMVRPCATVRTMSVLAASLLGLALGGKHALEADHLAAVSTLVARGGSVARAARAGALWGLGHGAVITLGGSALVLTGTVVPRPFAIALDIAVAAMLVGLGIAALVRRKRAAEHTHHHAGRPLAIGVVHGASGTAALTLLVATTIPGRTEALSFIGLFGLASIAGMAAVASILAVSMRAVASRSERFGEWTRNLAGAGSIAAGLAVGWGTFAAMSVG